MPPRSTYTARLLSSETLSELPQTKHLEFEVLDLEKFDFTAGQWVSLVYPREGKMFTRAYSLASGPRGKQFDLCLNRVDDGFFSNLLCDLREGQSIGFNGPHGLFVLKTPIRDSLFIATGTGVAPMRSFVQWLFPESGEDRSQGRQFYLVYGTRYHTDVYYEEYFTRIAARHPNFHYIVTLSRPEDGWPGERGYVQEQVRKVIESRPAETRHQIDAYICGLNNMVDANRKMLMQDFGWDKKQIVYERYD